jgi:hypothetical protein
LRLPQAAAARAPPRHATPSRGPTTPPRERQTRLSWHEFWTHSQRPNLHEDVQGRSRHRFAIPYAGRRRTAGGELRCPSMRGRGDTHTCSVAGGWPARRAIAVRQAAPSRSRCGCSPSTLWAPATSQSRPSSCSNSRRARTVASAAQERLSKDVFIAESNMCSTVRSPPDGIAKVCAQAPLSRVTLQSWSGILPHADLQERLQRAPSPQHRAVSAGRSSPAA